MSPFIVVALALVAAQAQAPASPPAEPQPQQAAPQQQPLDVITLDDALRAAAERSLDIQILRAQLDQAEEISWKAWSGYLPRATVTGAWQWQQEITAPIQAFWPPGTPPPPPGYPTTVTFQPDEVRQYQVEGTQTILSPSLFYGIRQANAAERAATLNIGNGRRALLFGVASAYYGAASLKQALAASERLLEIAQRQEKDARVRFQAGTIAKVGLLRAEIDRARAEQDLKRARNAFQSAKLALATLLARDAEFDVAEPPPPALPDDPGADALVKVALERRLDVQAARAQLDAARSGRKAAVGRYFPNVGAFGRYQGASAAGAFGGDENWAAGFALQWQILDGGLRESDLRESGAKVAQAEAAARRAELVARQEVLQALLDLDSARANAAKAREQRDLAAENLRLVDVSYRAGAATAVELADATAVLRNAEIGATTEGLNAQLAALRVLQAAGELEPGAKR
jgi:outer membrane protein TolC